MRGSQKSGLLVLLPFQGQESQALIPILARPLVSSPRLLGMCVYGGGGKSTSVALRGCEGVLMLKIPSTAFSESVFARLP